MEITIIGKDKGSAQRIKRGMAAEGGHHFFCFDGNDGYSAISGGPSDVIILEEISESLGTLTFVRNLRAKKITKPIIILRDMVTIEDVVEGLAAGADDVQPKSIEIPELFARLAAMHRRAGQDRGAEIHYKDLRLDPITHRVWRNGLELELTGREYNLFEYFMRHPGQVLSRVTLGDDVWKGEFAQFTNIIDVYVNYLRKKIDNGTGGKLIHTVRKEGYRFGER